MGNECAKNTVVWFEIPAADLDRAARFYEAVMGVKMKKEEMGGSNFAVFPHEGGTAGGCVQENPKAAGKGEGVKIYLNCNGFLRQAIDRAVAAGGKLALPIVELPMDMGSYAHIEDTEGNIVGLHSVK